MKNLSVVKYVSIGTVFNFFSFLTQIVFLIIQNMMLFDYIEYVIVVQYLVKIIS